LVCKWGDNSFKILGLTSIDTRGESLLSKLTSRQRQILLTGYALGYYDVPRKISSDDLSRHFNVDKSTIVEHIRKAERKLIGSIIAE
jgi:predicted DNA binding protein